VGVTCVCVWWIESVMRRGGTRDDERRRARAFAFGDRLARRREAKREATRGISPRDGVALVVEPV